MNEIEKKYNLTELYEKVETMIGTKTVWKEARIKDFLFDNGIYVESEEVPQITGILSGAFESFKIVSGMSDFKYAQKSGCEVGIILMFKYSLKRGEDSDINFARCHLKDGHWTIRKVWDM